MNFYLRYYQLIQIDYLLFNVIYIKYFKKVNKRNLIMIIYFYLLLKIFPFCLK